MGESESPRQAQYAIESGPGEGATFTVEQESVNRSRLIFLTLKLSGDHQKFSKIILVASYKISNPDSGGVNSAFYYESD